jgi:hypothetical protein
VVFLIRAASIRGRAATPGLLAWFAWLAWFALSTAACVPSVEESDTRVDAARVLAVRATPAEAAPRESVAFDALYADASGALTQAPLDWMFCLERKSLAELGPIAPLCLSETAMRETIGAGSTVRGVVPKDTCRLFGPDRAPAKEGEPSGRPVDPDGTGGYYQPIVLHDGDQDDFTTYEVRVACGLPGVTQAQYAEFNRRYQRNENPALEALELLPASGSGDPLDLLAPDDAAELPVHEVRAGETLLLRARWPECTSGDQCGDGLCGAEESAQSCAEDCATPSACHGSEYYLYFDPQGRELVTRREGIQLSWFATAGGFEAARGGRSESDASLASSDNQWTAPVAEGEVVLWVVLHDDRGGTNWHSVKLQVRAP